MIRDFPATFDDTGGYPPPIPSYPLTETPHLDNVETHRLGQGSALASRDDVTLASWVPVGRLWIVSHALCPQKYEHENGNTDVFGDFWVPYFQPKPNDQKIWLASTQFSTVARRYNIVETIRNQRFKTRHQIVTVILDLYHRYHHIP